MDARRAGTARDGASLGALLVVTAALLWALIGMLATPLLDRGFTPAAIAFWRAAIGGSVFVAHGLATRDLARQGRGLLIGFGVLGVGLFYVSLPAAIDTGGVSLAWLLLYTAPAWVALAAPRILAEPSDRRTVLLVVATVAGAALVAIGGGDGVVITPASLAWGATAGLTYASWYLVSQRAGTSPVATAALALPVGALVLLPFAQWPGADATVWLLLLALGVVSTYLPVLAYYTGLRRLPAARAAVLATIEPVAALLMAAAFLGERLAPLALAGAAVVVASAIAASRPARGSLAEPLVTEPPHP